MPLFLTPVPNPFEKYAGSILYSPYAQDSTSRIGSLHNASSENTLVQITIISNLITKALTRDYSQPNGWQDPFKNVSWIVSLQAVQNPHLTQSKSKHPHHSLPGPTPSGARYPITSFLLPSLPLLLQLASLPFLHMPDIHLLWDVCSSCPLCAECSSSKYKLG